MASLESQFVDAMQAVYRIIDAAYTSAPDPLEGGDIDDLIDLRADLESAADPIQDLLNVIDEAIGGS